MGKKYLIYLLVPVIIASLMLSSCIKEKKFEEKPPTPKGQVQPTTTETDANKLNFEDEKFIYSPEGDNPFDPIITTVIKINVDKIKLVGIIWEEGNPTALVEDENKVGFMLREGDFVDPDKNIKVVSIDKKCIVFDIRKDLFHVTKKYCLK